MPPASPIRTKVYPRARGEAGGTGGRSGSGSGLSPRSRGSLRDRMVRGVAFGSIPALAGKPAGHDPHEHSIRVYPRARGEAGKWTTRDKAKPGLSPRSRGSPARGGSSPPPSRSIPALAGKPSPRQWPRGPSTVYPRARGEAHRASGPRRALPGLSPRSRGSRKCSIARVATRRSIPALAGKPRRALSFA